MARRFYDLNVYWRIIDEVKDVGELVNICESLGFRGIALTVNEDELRQSSLLKKLKRIKSESERHGFDVALRLAIRSRSVAFSKSLLRKFRRYFEVVSMYNLTRSVASFACRDGRVDIVTYDPLGVKLYKGDIMNLIEYNKTVEFIILPLKETDDPLEAAKLIRLYQRVIGRMVKKGIRIMLTSGARSVRQLVQLHSMIALAKIFGMPQEEALRALSEVPEEILTLNRLKLRGLIPVRGVLLLDEGRLRELDPSGYAIRRLERW